MTAINNHQILRKYKQFPMGKIILEGWLEDYRAYEGDGVFRFSVGIEDR